MKRADPPHSQRWALYVSHLGSYMRRWIARLHGYTARIHNILKSDEGRDFHDHPFHFLSFILWGGYIEHRPGCCCIQYSWGETIRVSKPCHRYTAPAIVFRRATEFHRLELWRPSWTLVFTSRYIRSWGFLLPDGRWVGYKEYHRSYYQPQDGHVSYGDQP